MYEFKLQSEQPIELLLLGDMHIGHVNCNYSALEKVRDYIAEDSNHRVWIGMGDYLEMVGPLSGPKGAIWTQDMDPEDQQDWFVEFWKSTPPLALIDGNHELRLLRDWGATKVKRMSDDLNCIYAKSGGFFSFWINDVEYSLFLMHGSGRSTTPQYQLNALFAKHGVVSADLIAIGHMHRLYTDFIPIWNNRGEAANIEILRTGGFLGGNKWEDMPEYARSRGYSRGSIGCPIVRLSHDKKKIVPDIWTLRVV